MKNKALPLTLTILMASCLATSCGKKAGKTDSTPKDTKVQGVQADLIEETHKELKAAILEFNHNKVVKLLELKNQLDMDKILDDGETLLTLAVKLNQRKIIETLIKNNCRVNASNANKETAIMVAAKLGQLDLVKLFVSLDAKLDFKDISGNTALHLAILNRFEEIAIYLVVEKANYDITNDNNHTPLRLAEILNLSKIADYLRTKTQVSIALPDEANITNLIRIGDRETLAMLFNKYDSLKNAYPKLNYFVEAIYNNTHDRALDLITLFIQEGISIHGPANAETPLMSAVKKDDESIAEIFLELRANPNVIDENGKTALIWAIQRNSPVMVQTLLNYSAAKKYDYYSAGKKKTMKACDVVKEVKKLVESDAAQKKNNAEIKEILDCSFLGLF